jgi:hypothetical protein
VAFDAFQSDAEFLLASADWASTSLAYPPSAQIRPMVVLLVDGVHAPGGRRARSWMLAVWIGVTG